MKLLPLVIISLFLCLTFVSAEVLNCEFNLPTVKKGLCQNILQTCSNCSFVNVTTVYYPLSNGTILNLNSKMTQFINTYNYTFCDTNTLGIYLVSTFGNPDGTLTTGNICFEVTPTGDNLSNSQTVLYFVPLLIFGFLVFFLGHRFFISSTTSSKSVYFLLTYIIGLIPFVYSIYQLVSNYLPMQTFIINILYYFFFIVLILTPIVFIVCVAYLIIDLLNSSTKKTLVSRGHTSDEADARIHKRR